ncbi:HEPN-associated N-terminal domain-containing protein [Microtetraspora malaysiensis]|uniref:HEPN-associated N-terminal domain-containing protein n=1 Tax=Microtetraspora malaysiensis TaxID=161358 RepID=UPI003D90DFD7
MGDWVTEQQEQGWDFTSKSVCTQCVDDEALKAVLAADEDTEVVCDFCSNSPAAPFDTLMEAFVNGLRTEYGTADNEGVYWDGREGGYQWNRIVDSHDLVEQFGSDVLTGDGLLQAVQGTMHDAAWVEVDFVALREDEALALSWEQFCTTVKHHMRYVIWLSDADDEQQWFEPGEIPPSRILQTIGWLIDRLGLVRTLPAGYQLYRARTHGSDKVPTGATELGTAPVEYAKQANRMSPAGIPMFYGAETEATAIREVAVRSQDTHVTVGAFAASAAWTVVDFTQLPAIPSMFDPEWGRMRRSLIFLHDFREQLSKPARSTYEQIDYVPTQIVTEYLLRILGSGRSINGLLYVSALTGQTCAVLDVPADGCVEQNRGWADGGMLRLGLVPGSLKTRVLIADDTAV